MHPPGITAALRAAFPVTLPVLAGYLFLGAGYGILMANIGYGVLWAGALSAMVFGGTIQYIATMLLAQPFAPLNALIISLLVNARHLFYGVSLLEMYSGTGWKKPFLIFWMTDETFSLMCSREPPPGVDAGWFRFFVSGLDYLYWIAGGMLGAGAGHLFHFNPKGVEFVMTSLFTVIVLGQWQAAKTKTPALIGLVASFACLALFGRDHFLIPAMALIIALLMATRERIEGLIRSEEEEACQ